MLFGDDLKNWPNRNAFYDAKKRLNVSNIAATVIPDDTAKGP